MFSFDFEAQENGLGMRKVNTRGDIKVLLWLTVECDLQGFLFWGSGVFGIGKCAWQAVPHTIVYTKAVKLLPAPLRVDNLSTFAHTIVRTQPYSDMIIAIFAKSFSYIGLLLR